MVKELRRRHHVVARPVDRGRSRSRTASGSIEAFDRWRELFTAALVDQASRTGGSSTTRCPSATGRSRSRRRKEAETQLNLLKNESVDSKSVLSDFNPYRYLASEGFLPGYSFPRLPLAAYIPTSARRFGDGDYLQRPRFLAIREFGPGALIYHEGARYQVSRIQLPPGGAGDLVTTSAKRCSPAATTTTARTTRRLRDVRRAAACRHGRSPPAAHGLHHDAGSGSPPTRRSAGVPGSAW